MRLRGEDTIGLAQVGWLRLALATRFGMLVGGTTIGHTVELARVGLLHHFARSQGARPGRRVRWCGGQPPLRENRISQSPLPSLRKTPQKTPGASS